MVTGEPYISTSISNNGVSLGGTTRLFKWPWTSLALQWNGQIIWYL